MTSPLIHSQALHKRPLIGVFTTIFIDFLGFGLIIPVVPALFSDANFTIFDPSFSPEDRKFWYAIMMGVFSVCTFVFAPLLGTISDRIGRRRVLMINNVGNGSGYIIIAIGVLMHSPWVVIFGRIIPGMIGSSVFIVQSAIADVSTPDTKNQNFGLVGVAFGLGFIIGAILGGVLSDGTIHPWFNPTLPLFVAGGVNLINLTFVTLFLPETHLNRKFKRINPWSGFVNIRRAFAIPSLRMLFSMIFFLVLGFSFYVQFLPIFVQDKFGFGEMEVGFVFAFIGIVAALGQGVGIRLAAKFTKPTQLILYTIPILSISYLVMLIPDQVPGLYGAIAFLILFQSITFPNTLAIVSNKTDPSIQGEIIGINQSMQALGSALSAFVAASVAVGDIGIIMWMGALFTVIGYVIYYRGRKMSQE